APLISHNGALIKYADSLETVAASLLPTETALEAVRVGKEFGGDALVSTDPHGKETLLYDLVADDNVPFQRYIRWSEMLHGDDAYEAVRHVDSLEPILADHEVIHISFSGTCVRMDEMIEFLKN